MGTLVWGSDSLITTPVMTTALGLKQNLLQGISTTSTDINILLNTAVFGDSTGQVTIYLKSAPYQALIFANSGQLAMVAGYGSALNLISGTSGTALSISNSSANITYYGSLTSASDKRLKTEIEDVSLQSCLSLLSVVDMKTYQRLDTPEENRPFRLGVLAQDVQAGLPSDGKFDNLIDTFLHGEEDDNKQEMLSVSYDRLSCILWTVVKSQQKQLQELTARVALLE